MQGAAVRPARCRVQQYAPQDVGVQIRHGGRYSMDGSTALAVLGLEPGATKQQIKTTFRALVKGAHPDAFGVESTDRFVDLHAAYERALVGAPDAPAPATAAPRRRGARGADSQVRRDRPGASERCGMVHVCRAHGRYRHHRCRPSGDGHDAAVGRLRPIGNGRQRSRAGLRLDARRRTRRRLIRRCRVGSGVGTDHLEAEFGGRGDLLAFEGAVAHRSWQSVGRGEVERIDE